MSCRAHARSAGRVLPGRPARSASPSLTNPVCCTYRVLMLRMLMLIALAIVVVWVAVLLLHFLLWVFMIGLILIVAALALGVFRVGRRSARRSR